MLEYAEIVRVVFELLVLIAAVTPTQRDDDVLDRIRNMFKLIKVIK